MASSATQPSLGDLFRQVLATLFASPAHTVDPALMAHVQALDDGLATTNATVATMGGHVADDEDKIASVKSDIAGIRDVLTSFASSTPGASTLPGTTPPDPASPPADTTPPIGATSPDPANPPAGTTPSDPASPPVPGQ